MRKALKRNVKWICGRVCFGRGRWVWKKRVENYAREERINKYFYWFVVRISTTS